VRQYEESLHASAAVSVCAGAMARACTHERARPGGRMEEGDRVRGVRGCVYIMDGWMGMALGWRHADWEQQA